MAGLLEERGYIVENVDATVIAQRPKLRPHIDEMCRNMAAALGVEQEQINVKATTEEGLGFTGSGEGISAQAVCLLEKATNYGSFDVTPGKRPCDVCEGCAVLREDNEA